MDLSSKKSLVAQEKKTENESQGERENDTNEIAQSLYKQNLELAVKNKTLSLLSKLYNISILTLPPKELALRISTIIQSDFSFELVGIFLYDEVKDTLFPLAFSESERFKIIQSDFNTFFATITIPNASRGSFLNGIISGKTIGYTESLSDIWDSIIPKEVFEKIKTDGHVRSSLVCPLVIEKKVIGVLILSLNRVYTGLVSYEKESIKSFINVIAVAFDKALLYEELKATNSQLEMLNTRLESLVHFVSHEVKGALGKSRVVFNEILEKTYGAFSPEIGSLVTQADRDTKKTVAMVMDILDSTDLKDGKIKMDMKPFDMKHALLEIVESAKNEAQSKGLFVKTEIDDATSFMVTGDKDKITQHVIRNLIDNSVRYTPKGGITISLAKKDGHVLFSVKDTGVGISEEDKMRLFTEGGRGANSVKVNVSSTGYGLFFAKGIMDAHGGKIWAESEGPGKGSTFFVEFA